MPKGTPLPKIEVKFAYRLPDNRRGFSQHVANVALPLDDGQCDGVGMDAGVAIAKALKRAIKLVPVPAEKVEPPRP